MSLTNELLNRTATQRVRSNKTICAAFLGALLLAAFGFWLQFSPRFSPPKHQLSLSDQAFKDEETVRKRLAGERQQRLDAIKIKVAHMMGDTHTEMLNTVKFYREKANQIIAACETREPGLIAHVDDKLQGYPNALGLARRIAKDKVFKTQDTDAYLRDALQPVTDSQVALGANLQRVQDECTESLRAESARLQAGLADVTAGTDFKMSDFHIDENVRRLVKATANQAFKSSISSVNATLQATIEGLLLASTYEALSRVLAGAVARETVSLSIGAGGAPIPFIDIATTIIAVGGTAWTAHDVYKAVEEMKQIDAVIRQEIHKSTAELKKNSDQAFSDQEEKIATLFK